MCAREMCSVCVCVGRMGEAAYLDHAISSNQSASPDINIYMVLVKMMQYMHTPPFLQSLSSLAKAVHEYTHI